MGTEVTREDQVLSNVGFNEQGKEADATVVDAAIDDGIGQITTIAEF
jgi:hypothetical protein